MPAMSHGLLGSIEAHRAHAGSVELPPCDGLRMCAALTATAQCLMGTRVSEAVDLSFGVRMGFLLSGFLLARFLLQGRKAVDRGARGTGTLGVHSWGRSALQALPISTLFLVVAGVVVVPRLFALEAITLPEFYEVPAWFNGQVARNFEDFRKSPFDGKSLQIWPLILLFAPRRVLGLAFFAVLGSGLMIQLAGLASGEIRPASALVDPSALDLLAAGSLAAAIFHEDGRSDGARIGRWAVLMGLAVGLAAISVWSQDRLPSWGAVSMLSAPPGFGAVNFLLEIVATTLVASLSWRDLRH